MAESTPALKGLVAATMNGFPNQKPTAAGLGGTLPGLGGSESDSSGSKSNGSTKAAWRQTEDLPNSVDGSMPENNKIGLCSMRDEGFGWRVGWWWFRKRMEGGEFQRSEIGEIELEACMEQGSWRKMERATIVVRVGGLVLEGVGAEFPDPIMG